MELSKFQHGIKASSGSLKTFKEVEEEEDSLQRFLQQSESSTEVKSSGISQRKQSCCFVLKECALSEKERPSV